MRAILLSAFIGLSICAFVLRRETKPVRRYHCYMDTDGIVHCFAADGHIFRPRFDKFVMEVEAP